MRNVNSAQTHIPSSIVAADTTSNLVLNMPSILIISHRFVVYQSPINVRQKFHIFMQAQQLTTSTTTYGW